MEPSTCRMLLVVLFATATVTEAMNYLALPRMGRSGYIAFPRLGRGYLAFPRLGRRSQAGSDVTDNGASCCMTGLKTEWLLAEDGKTTTQNVCSADTCCEGLQEILDQKPDGAFYSLCIPSCTGDSKTSTSENSENVLRKLKGLLQN